MLILIQLLAFLMFCTGAGRVYEYPSIFRARFWHFWLLANWFRKKPLSFLWHRKMCTAQSAFAKAPFSMGDFNEMCLEGRNIWLLHEVIYRKHVLSLSHLWHYHMAYFCLIYSARFPCLYKMIPTKYFWFPKDPAPAVQSISTEEGDCFSPS